MAADSVKFEKRMSDMDALMWSIEKDPLLRSTIMAVAVLDQAPDRDRLLEKVERGTRMIPRLRHRAVAAPLVNTPPNWVVDANFDIDYHLRFLRAGGDGSLRSLLDLAQPMAMQSFDRARPLWEFIVVEGLADGRAALIQKVHHSVTDGVGGIKLALMLLDLERDPARDTSPIPEPEEIERPSALDLMIDGLQHERRRSVGMAQRSIERLIDAARQPGATAARVAEMASSMARVLAPATSPMSPLMTGRSLSVRFDTLTIPLAEAKAAAKLADGKLNDAFVAAAAGGMARYHRRHGFDDVEALRMTMPISIRSEGEMVAGNQFVPARFPIPLLIVDPVERMRMMRELVTEQRDEPALGLTEPVASVLNRLPTSVVTQLFGSMLKGVDFVTSNVPGAPFTVYLAGGRVEASFAFGPLTGAAANLTLLSSADELFVGVNTDPAAIPDPEVFVECLQEGFDEIIKLA